MKLLQNNETDLTNLSPEEVYLEDCKRNDKFMLALMFSHLPWIIIFAYDYGTVIPALVLYFILSFFSSLNFFLLQGTVLGRHLFAILVIKNLCFYGKMIR